MPFEDTHEEEVLRAPPLPFTAFLAPNLPAPPPGTQFTAVGMVRIRGRRNKLARGLDREGENA